MILKFTDQFRSTIDNTDHLIEFNKFRFGNPSNMSTPDISGMTMENLESLMTLSSYNQFHSIYSKDLEILDISLIPSEVDDSIWRTNPIQYQVIVFFYTDLVTGYMDIAMYMCDPKPRIGYYDLAISRYRNLIRINIPIECEIKLDKDTDTSHLESAGVWFSNIYSIGSSYTDKYYVDKKSYDRYYYNEIISDSPYYGESTINKFGLKSY